MEQSKINRINELARKKKASGLTEAELKEQKKLREEYLLYIRQGFSFLGCEYITQRRAKPHFDGCFPQNFGYAQIELCPFLFIVLIHGGVLLRRVPVP